MFNLASVKQFSSGKQLMRASCFKTIPFSLAKPALNVHCHFLHLRHINSQAKFRKTHDDKLDSNDYQILHCLSINKLEDARKLIDKTIERNHPHWLVVHFTSLLTKYSKNGFIDESQMLFELMPYKNIVTYNAMLSGLLHNGRLSEAVSLFEVMPERNVVSWTAMICGLADGGRISEARRLFQEMPVRNVVSWNSMVVGLIRNGELKEARQVFDSMPEKNVVSWNAMISGYVESRRMREARALFEEMEERNVVTWTSMISGYCRAGEVKEGYLLFRTMPEKNIVSWTAMIGGFTWNGFHEEALLLFIEMRRKYDVRPNRETFISLAYACAGMGFPHPGRQLHAQVIVNMLEYDDYDGRLSKSLIHMYSIFGIMDFAHCIFNKNMHNCNVQSFNSLISGYIRVGKLEEAQNLFETIPVRDEISWTIMIDAYLSVGDISNASYLFYNMPYRDAVAWTAMISGYVQNELFVEATYLFLEMRAHSVAPLNSTYSILLGAAGAMANLDQGRQLHCMLIKTQSGFDLILENSLISMYAKCGVIDKVFDLMLQSGTYPNCVTFLGILSTCSNAGQVSRGWELFYAMYDKHATEPSLEVGALCLYD